MHIEMITASATAAASTGAAAAAVGSDSLTVKNGIGDIHILHSWQSNQTAGFGQILFPTAHDTTRGYRAGVQAGTNAALMSFGAKMRVRAQETLAITIAATAVAGDVELQSHLLRYDNFPGIEARLMTAAQVQAKMDDLTTIEEVVTATAGPSYGTPETFLADSDLLRANRDYAIMGMTTRTAVHAIYAQTPDAGNVRFGVPGILREEVTSQWFMLLSRMFGEPLVPVFNSGNKNQCFIGVCANENAGVFTVDLHLALLK